MCDMCDGSWWCCVVRGVGTPWQVLDEHYDGAESDYEVVGLLESQCECPSWNSIVGRFSTAEGFAAFLHDQHSTEVTMQTTVKSKSYQESFAIATAKFLAVTSVGAMSGAVPGTLDPEALFQTGRTQSGRQYTGMLRVNYAGSASRRPVAGMCMCM